VIDNRGNRQSSARPQPPATDFGPGAVVAKVGELLENAVQMLRFFGKVSVSIPRAVRLYPSEVLRQCGILILSSGMIIWFMELVLGVVFAVQGHYISRQFGAPGYVGVYPALGGLRTGGPEMWGWILAAKVGCGLVAELGSMRISEEVDALEVMGVEPVPYLVGTRVLAATIAMPFLYIQSPLDLLFSMIWTVVLGVLVVLVGCYYGYTAKGGPVGVGMNTSRSMVINMVLVSLLGLIFHQLFWGGFANAPIAN
jgi:phospholipid/cholesterol/gamma-HCH transport system permease protein